MEERGIRVGRRASSRPGQETWSSDLTEHHEYAMQELAGENFNVNSTKVLGEVLFEKLRIQDEAGVKRPKRTKTGWATDAGDACRRSTRT